MTTQEQIIVKPFDKKSNQNGKESNNMYVQCLFKAFNEFLEAETKGHQNSVEVFDNKVKAASLIFKEDKKALSKNHNPFA